jgi:hypothetical protein
MMSMPFILAMDFYLSGLILLRQLWTLEFVSLDHHRKLSGRWVTKWQLDTRLLLLGFQSCLELKVNLIFYKNIHDDLYVL